VVVDAQQRDCRQAGDVSVMRSKSNGACAETLACATHRLRRTRGKARRHCPRPCASVPWRRARRTRPARARRVSALQPRTLGALLRAKTGTHLRAAEEGVERSRTPCCHRGSIHARSGGKAG
jgi:hypothetical protein